MIAHITRIDAVHQNLVVIRIAAADKQRGLRPALARLHNKSAGHQSQCARQVVAQGQVERPKYAGGGAGLRLWRGSTGSRHHDRLARPFRFKHHVAFDRVELSGEKARRLQLAKALCRNHQEEAPIDTGEYLKAAVGRGNSGGNYFSVADQNHVGSGHLGARCVGNHAANRRSRADCDSNCEQNGGKCARKFSAQVFENRHDGSFVPLGTQSG